MKIESKRGIGGKNSFYFSLIHCEYIYIKANLTFLIDYNSIYKVNICYNTCRVVLFLTGFIAGFEAIQAS